MDWDLEKRLEELSSRITDLEDRLDKLVNILISTFTKNFSED